VLWLLTLLLFWYGIAAFPLVDLFECATPEISDPIHVFELCGEQRELLDNFLTLTSNSCCHGMVFNALKCRSNQSFDPKFIAKLLSNRGSLPDLFEIILDTGCIFAITPYQSDFIEYLEGQFGTVNTVAGPTAIAGYGKVEWTVVSDNRHKINICVPCHHVPGAKVCLVSPQDYCLYHGFDRSRDQFVGNSSYFWMHLADNSNHFQCSIDPPSNLPIALGYCCSDADLNASPPREHKEQSECQYYACGLSRFTVADESNQNLLSGQKELLTWHWRLAHIGFDNLQRLMTPLSTSKQQMNSASDPAPCLTKKRQALLFVSLCCVLRVRSLGPNVEIPTSIQATILAKMFYVWSIYCLVNVFLSISTSPWCVDAHRRLEGEKVLDRNTVAVRYFMTTLRVLSVHSTKCL
jgi:hypothetical protein